MSISASVLPLLPLRQHHHLALLCVGAQSCLTLCNPMDGSPPGSSVPGILQARILEWIAISTSRESSQSGDGTQVSRIADRFFTSWATREATIIYTSLPSTQAPYKFLNSVLFPYRTINALSLQAEENRQDVEDKREKECLGQKLELPGLTWFGQRRSGGTARKERLFGLLILGQEPDSALVLLSISETSLILQNRCWLLPWLTSARKPEASKIVFPPNHFYEEGLGFLTLTDH